MSVPSNPGWKFGYVPSASEWNNTFARKADFPVPVGQGGTGGQTTAAANINLQQRVLVSASPLAAKTFTRYSFKTAGSAFTVNLPDIRTLANGDWIDLLDVDGNAAINPIALDGFGSQTIKYNGTTATTQIITLGGSFTTLVVEDGVWAAVSQLSNASDINIVMPVYDEGSKIANARSLNFVGSGVAVTDMGGDEVAVTIPGISQPPIVVAGTSRTLAIADTGQYLLTTAASAVVVTIPPNSLAPFVVGTTIEIEQGAAGAVTITPGSGVTLNNSDLTFGTTYAHSVMTLKKIATNSWTLSGGDVITRRILASNTSGEGAGLLGTTLGITGEAVNDGLVMMAPWIGAMGDGSDCRTVVNNYLATNTRLHFPARVGTRATSRYGVSGAILVKQNNTHISFDAGARLVPNGFDPTTGQVLNVTGTAPAGWTALSANASQGDNTITTATDPGWAVGDHLEIRSEAVITGCPNVYLNKCAVGRRISAKTGSGPVVWTLDVALPYSFNVADTAVAGKCTMIENVVIDGAVFNDENFGTNIFSFPIYLRYVYNITIINPEGYGTKVPYGPDYPTGDFIKMFNCRKVTIVNPRMRHGAYYGLSIFGWTEDVRSTGGNMEDVRHAVSVVWQATGNDYGQPINVHVSGMTAWNTTLSSFDTHDTGRDIVFELCSAYAAGDDGFQARTTNVRYTDCRAEYSYNDGFSQAAGASGLMAENCVSVNNGRIGVNWNFATATWTGGRITNNGSPVARGGLKPGGGPGFTMYGGIISAADIYDNPGVSAIIAGSGSASFTATISNGSGGAGTLMTVSGSPAPTGPIEIGAVLTGGSVAAGTIVVSQVSGFPLGDAGVYVVSVSQNLASTALTSKKPLAPLLITNCDAPASAAQTSLVGAAVGTDLSLVTLRNNDIPGYGNTMFQNFGTLKNISPVTSGNQITATGAYRGGFVTLNGGLATVTNPAIRNKTAAAFGEAIICNVDLRRGTLTGIAGALYVAQIVDQASFTIKSTNFVEPTRTNVIRNNTNVGAVNGALPTPGVLPTNWSSNIGSGLTLTVVGTGTEVGPGGGTQNYIDLQVSGTASATLNLTIPFDTSNNPAAAAAAGQTWTGSFGAKLVGGAMTGISTFIDIASYTSGGSTVDSFFTAITIGATALRYAKTSTLTGAAAFVRLLPQFTVTNGTTVNATVRIYMPQLEQAANASAPIATSGSAVTRTADTLNADNSVVEWAMSL